MIARLTEITDKKSRLCAGVMSGTSLAGIDIALCEITGRGNDIKVQLLHFETAAYTKEEKASLLRACSPETSSVEDICLLNKKLGTRIGSAVAAAAKRVDIPLSAIDFVASHGQTVYHAPAAGATLQIGDLTEIAAATGAVTVGDFRPSDMAYGGQGAPLVPYVDNVLYRSRDVTRVLVNIGGMSNLTTLGQKDDLLAFGHRPGQCAFG